MNRLWSTAVLCSCFFTAIYSQEEPQDPFGWTEPIYLNSSDIFLLWSQGEDANSMTTFRKVYTYEIDSAAAPPQNRLFALGKDSSDSPIAGNKKLFLASGNLNSDAFDDVIAVWEKADQKIELLIAQFDTTEAFWKAPVSITIDDPIVAGSGEQGRIFLRTGDFDADGEDEFALAYLGSDLTIRIKIYDTGGTLVPGLVDEINDIDLSGLTANQIRFDMATGDFDNDGVDEIVVVSYDPAAAEVSEQGLFAKIYDITGSALVPKVRKVIIPRPAYTISSYELAVASFPFHASGKDEFAVAFTYQHNESSNVDDTYLFPVETDTNLEDLQADLSKGESDYKNPNDVKPVLISTGDLNKDGKSELVFAIGNTFSVYTPDDQLNLNKKSSGGIPGSGDENLDLEYSYEFLAVGDIDQTEGDEIVVTRNIFSDDWENPFAQHFELSVYGVGGEDLNTLTLKARFDDEEEVPYEWPNRNYALVLGNFDASKVIIDQPIHYRLTDINQPLVILNIPPIHFDVFDTVSYDINNCYDGDCQFRVQYIKTNSETNAVTTEIKSSWDVTGGLIAKGSTGVAVGAGVQVSVDLEFENYLLGKYGKNFENTNSSSETVAIQVAVDVSEDDQIYATFTDYDVWKYPYREGNSTKASGEIYVFTPLQSEGRWYPSKSASGNTYQPKHEIGNILSYPKFGSQDNDPDIFQNIYNPASSTTYTLNSSTNYTWTYAKEKFDQTTAFTSVESSLDVKRQAFSYFQYEQNNAYVYSYTNSLSEEITLIIDLGQINRTFGPTEYRVTPYVYWSKQGAMVVDYTVEPDIDSEGGSTWWQEMYGDLPDPTVILPWKFDPEKGLGITEDEKRRQTRDIQLDPPAPSGGDTVLITMHVRNFSLKDTDGPVGVEFYMNNPDAGGTLLQNVSGETAVSTQELIPARGYKTVSFEWLVPDNITESARIYAVIDPDDQIGEVHEGNNVGWTPLKNYGLPTSLEEFEHPKQESIGLMQNYPNPFGGISRIDYSLRQRDEISLQVYDIYGRLVRVYEQGPREQGTHTIEISGTDFDTGVYFYMLLGRNSASSSRKMFVIH